jgi:hypothetical protein
MDLGVGDLARRLGDALASDDAVALAELMSRTVRLVIDSGDHSGGEWRGRELVITVLRDRYRYHRDASLQLVHVNGAPGLALHRADDGVIVGVLAIGSRGRGGRITELWLAMAPQKLLSWNRRRGSAREPPSAPRP